MNPDLSRRNFLKTTAAASAAVSAFNIVGAAPKSGHVVKVALIGCGGRAGRDLPSFRQACKILGYECEVVALADAFKDKAEGFGKKHGVPADQCYGGYDAYKKVVESDAHFIILTTPPNFRPIHFEAAVEAGKNVFMEKPVAVDPPGVRKVIEIGEKAKEKGLAVVAGTQRRHHRSYLDNKAAIDAGAIGEILGGVVQWNGRVPWVHKRKPEYSDAEYITRNWLNFVELSGDHICEQHVHNLDVANWFIGRTPVTAIGFGGRARRITGNMFDFFSVDLDYGNGLRIHSQCRQINGAYGRVGEFFRGADGECFGGGKLTGKKVNYRPIEVENDNGTVQEHIDLIKSVVARKPLNEARNVAEATLTAIMGRIACYTGEMVRWRDLMENEKSPHYNLTLGPAAHEFEKGPVKAPSEDVFPLPGKAGGINVRG